MKIQTIRKYERGLNEYLDRILEDEEVWVIQGDNGLVPVIADTEDQARIAYMARDQHDWSSQRG